MNIMILIIDNYDSFTYNLVQYVGELNLVVRVIRNDIVSLEEIKSLSPTCIIISPGPGSPQDSGISISIIQYLPRDIPILGVCLGHQAIGFSYGAIINHGMKPMHGKNSLVYHNGQGIFHNIANPFIVARYHSLVIDAKYIPKDLLVNAWSNDGIIMGCTHKLYPNLYGIQFHPESLWTLEGKKLIYNFLSSAHSHII